MKNSLLILFCALITACTPKLEQYFISSAEIIRQVDEAEAKKREELNSRGIRLGNAQNPGCFDVQNYTPTKETLSHFPQYTLRVNFHIIDTKDRRYNYSEAAAEKMIGELMGSANKDLRDNNEVWLPYGNSYPKLPIGYTMKLSPNPDIPGDKGIYFHQDDNLAFYVHKGKNRNIHLRGIINKYSVGGDSILNIFIMPHHPDSVLSPTYHVGGVGVYLGNGIKMAGMFELNQPGWNYRGVLNHEIGHALGLQHAWLQDGCDDTPRHNNECWNRGSKAPCDTAASNNIMDYNAYQNAWSPCQVGRIRRTLANIKGKQRRWLVPHWNQLDTSKNIVIRDSVHWAGAKDLKGNLIIAQGAQLKLSCRLGMPLNSTITIAPGAKLILDNAEIHHPAGRSWQGIKVEKQGKFVGQLILKGDAKILHTINPIE